MGRKGLKLAAAGALVIGITVVLLVSVPNSGVAFAQVMEKMASVQTLHARMTVQGKSREIWAKRPNMLRINYDDGTYEISNGAILWIVNEKTNRATKEPSYYYQQAQRLGVDALDTLMDVRYFGGGDLTGFFSEGPVERVTRDGRAFDVYRMEFEQRETKVHFEAFADARTHLIESLRLEAEKEGSRQTMFESRILAYDEPMPDDMFAFRPAEGMEVSDETVKGEEGEQLAPPEPTGASLSGRVVWASSGKPVLGALIQIGAKYDPRGSAQFRERVETDSDGRWRIEGVPEGRCTMGVHSWELDWPAEPIFAGNVGTPEHPAVLVEGPREYSGLDFRVHKPSDFYARISIKVTDEDGNPVQGVGATLAAYTAGRGFKQVQTVNAGLGKQFTGPDGEFNAKDIWPYSEPVCVELHSYTEPLRYAAYVATSEPFVVEPKGQYRFEVVLPFGRDLPLKVTDLEGNPLAWVGVSAIYAHAGRLTYVFPRYGEKPTVTDADGVVTVRGLAPNRKFVLFLYRLPEGESDHSKAIASARTTVEVPAERQPGITQVAFDPRPIRIEGKVDVPPGDLGRVQLGLSDAETGCEFGLLGQKIGDDGQFVQEGVPAGTVRVVVFFVGPDKKIVLRATGNITTEPGHAYFVQVVEDRVEVARVEKIE